MRRALLLFGALVVLAAAAGGGVVLGMAIEDDEHDDGITDAEHDRLLDVCIYEWDAPADCAEFVAAVVDEAVAAGCGCREAAGRVAALADRPEFAVEEAHERWVAERQEAIYAGCREGDE